MTGLYKADRKDGKGEVEGYLIKEPDGCTYILLNGAAVEHYYDNTGEVDHLYHVIESTLQSLGMAEMERENKKLNLILYHRENGLSHPDLQGDIDKSKMATLYDEMVTALKWINQQPCEGCPEGTAENETCSDTGSCITEWCLPCYAGIALAKATKLKEKP